MNPEVSTGAVLAFLALFVRASAYLWSMPLLADPYLPARLRIGAAAAFSLALAPTRPELGYEEFFLSLPLEAVFGLAAGFAGRLLLAGAEAGGQLIGIQAGLGFASFLDPSTREEALPTRRIALCLAGLTFLSLGGLDSVVRVLVSSPLSGASLGAAEVLVRGGDVLAAGVRVAAPSIVAGLVFQLGLAISSRAVPALNLFSTALPVLLLGGGLALWLTAPAFVGELSRLARHAIELFGEAR